MLGKEDILRIEEIVNQKVKEGVDAAIKLLKEELKVKPEVVVPKPFFEKKEVKEHA